MEQMNAGKRPEMQETGMHFAKGDIRKSGRSRVDGDRDSFFGNDTPSNNMNALKALKKPKEQPKD